MKSTGIVRKIDDLGRVVLPIELRRTLGLEVGDGIEIFTEDDSIVLKKHQATCVFCGSEKKLKGYENKLLCSGCRKKIGSL